MTGKKMINPQKAETLLNPAYRSGFAKVLSFAIAFAAFSLVFLAFKLTLFVSLVCAFLILLTFGIYALFVKLFKLDKSFPVSSKIFTTFSAAVFFVVLALLTIASSAQVIIIASISLVFFAYFTALYFAGREAQTRKARKLLFFKEAIIRTLLLFVVVSGLLFFARGFLLDFYYIPSNSMYPTLWGGEIIAADKTYSFCTPKRWDIVVFKHPGYAEKLVKRIAGLPGEKLMLTGGNVYINGKIALRPQEVLFSQMMKPAVCYFNFAKSIADEAGKHSSTSIKWLGNKKKQGKWAAALGENMDNASQPQIAPLSEAEISREFARWFSLIKCKKYFDKGSLILEPTEDRAILTLKKNPMNCFL